MSPRLTRFVKSLSWTVGSIIGLMMLITWLVTLPSIQSWLVWRARWAMEQVLQTEVAIEAVEVGLPAKAVIQGIKIADQQQDTLASVKELRLSALNFSLWDYLFDEQKLDQLRIQHLDLEEPKLTLYKGATSGKWNLQFILDAFASEDSTPSGKPLGIRLEGIDIQNGQFLFIDSTKMPFTKGPGRVNYAHLALREIYGDLGLKWYGDGSIGLEIEGLRAQEVVSGCQLDRLDLELQSFAPSADDQAHMELSDLQVITPHSHVYAKAFFPDQSLLDLIEAPDSLYARITLEKGSRIGVPDLTFFSGPLPLAGTYHVNGIFSATPHRIRGGNVRIDYLDATHIQTNFELRDFIDYDRLYLSAQLIKSTITTGELRQMLPDQGLPTVLDRLQLVELDGNFNGHPEDFQIDLETHTELGYLGADMHVVLPPRSPSFTYDGQLSTQDLQVDALQFLDQPLSRRLTFNGTVKGQGLTLSELTAEVKAGITRSDIMGYAVDTLYTRFQIENQQLSGRMAGSDGKGSAELAFGWDGLHSPAQYQLDGFLDQLNLETYGLVDTQIIATTQLHLDISGDSLEALRGEIGLSQATLNRPQDELSFSLPDFRLRIIDTFTNVRYITLSSNLLSLGLTGDFTFADLNGLGQKLMHEADLFLENDTSLLHAYYDSLATDTNYLNFQLGIVMRKDLNQLFSFAGIPLEVADNTTILTTIGNDASGEGINGTEIFLDLKTDSISYSGIHMMKGHLNSSLLKYEQRNNFAFTCDFDCDQLWMGRAFAFENIVFNAEGAQNKYTSELDFFQPESEGRGKFQTLTRFLSGGNVETRFLTQNSYLDIHGDTLLVDSPNAITFKGSEIEIFNLMLRDPHPKDQPRYYRFDGMISEDPQEELVFYSSGFDLETLTAFYPIDLALDGVFNMDVYLRDLFRRPIIDFTARLDGLAIDEYPYGNILAQGIYDDSLSEVRLRTNLYTNLDTQNVYLGDTTLSLFGKIQLTESDSALDLHVATPKGIPLNYIEPFAQGELRQIQGRVHLSSFDISGPLVAPKIDGKGTFTESGFIVDYFKTRYTFTGDLIFDNERVLLEQVSVMDPFGQKAQLYGSIRHKGLEDFTFNLQLASAPNFLVMNTKRRDNDLFYGSMRLNQALASIKGNLDELKVEAYSSFAPGSRLVLPISDVSDFQKPEFIVFADEQSDSIAFRQAHANLSGVNMSLTALTSEDLEVELIFDERIGDRIRARGNGAITLDIDPQGNFTMNGIYEITQGDYLFTSEYLINKLFKVQPGSTISWDSDPYKAEIDIEAYYPLYADVNQLYPSEANTSSNRTLVHVVMRLKGELLQPEVDLAIRLPSIDQQSVDQIASLLQSIENDEQQLNNQIFSLILFNRFVPVGTGGFGDNTAGTAISTGLSELFSSRLNYWVSQATNDRLSVGVNAASAQEVNLLLSAKLFNDRVKIERDGILFNSQTETALTPQDIIGNVSVEIRLNETGTGGPQPQKPELVFAVFNRESLQVEGGIQNIYQTGAGIIYKRDFDKIGELLSRNSLKEKP